MTTRKQWHNSHPLLTATTPTHCAPTQITTTMTPAIIVGHGMLQGSVVSSEEWRRHGETRRKELLEQDKLEGGTSFEISKKCNVKHYFEIGDRVRIR